MQPLTLRFPIMSLWGTGEIMTGWMPLLLPVYLCPETRRGWRPGFRNGRVGICSPLWYRSRIWDSLTSGAALRWRFSVFLKNMIFPARPLFRSAPMAQEELQGASGILRLYCRIRCKTIQYVFSAYCIVFLALYFLKFSSYNK